MGRLKSLQVLRFVAVAMVVWAHALWAVDSARLQTGLLRSISRAGALGVDLFFVISGAIIYRTAFGGSSLSPTAFIRKRLVRIAPLYYVITLAWVFLGTAIGVQFEPEGFLTAMTFWPIWGGFSWPPVVIGWSLSFEMLFYAGAALVLVSRRWLWALWALFPVMWLARDLWGWPIAKLLGSPMILEFGAGMLAMRLKDVVRAPKWIFAATIGGATVFLAIAGFGAGLPDAFYDAKALIEGDTAGYRAAICAVPFALIVWGALQFKADARWLAPLTYLGDASYSIYLTHWVLFAALIPALHLANAPIVAIVLALIDLGLLAGCAVYAFVERPLLAALRAKHQVPATA